MGGSLRAFLRNSKRSGPLVGGMSLTSLVKYRASHLPLNPVRSISLRVVFLEVILNVPPRCHCQSAPSVPKVVASRFPPILTANFPGAPGAFHLATQSLVRTWRRYVPVEGNVTSVVASATGVPRPCAMR